MARKATSKARTRGDISPVIAEVVADMERLCETLERDIPIEGRFTVHRVALDFAAPEYAAEDVRRIRDALGASQPVFAKLLGADHSTVKGWEQGIRKPSGMARRFLQEIEADPEYWRARVAAAIKVREG